MPKWDTCYRDNDNCEQSFCVYYHDNIEEVLEWLQYEEKPCLPPGGNGTTVEKEEHGSELWDDQMRIWLENYWRLFLEY